MSEVLEKIVSTTVEKLGPSDKLGALMRTSKILPEEFKVELSKKLKASEANDNATNWYQSGAVVYSVKTVRQFELFGHVCKCVVTKYELHVPDKK